VQNFSSSLDLGKYRLESLFDVKPNITGVYCISPWLNLTHSDSIMAQRQNDAKDVLFPTGRYEELVSQYIPLHARSLLSSPFVSPGLMYLDQLRGLPPVLLHAGSADGLIVDIEEFASNLSKVGKGSLVTWPGYFHAWQVFPFAPKELADSFDSLNQFIQANKKVF